MSKRIRAGQKRLLAVVLVLARPGHVLLVSGPDVDGQLTDSAGRPLMHVPADMIRHLRSSGLVRDDGDRLSATETTQHYIRRMLGGDHAYLAQHLPIGPVEAATEAPVIGNLAESPLAWLRRRRDNAGNPFLDEAQYAAGERLRADAGRAGLVPSVGARWDPTGVRTAYRDSVLDGTLDARDRVNAALTAVGPDMSGLLLDVCCYLKGLEQVEADRSWPPRSARVVLGLALTRLAAHYGLTAVAVGRPRAAVQAWRSKRPRSGEQVAGVSPDALDHGVEPVRPLGGQML